MEHTFSHCPLLPVHEARHTGKRAKATAPLSAHRQYRLGTDDRLFQNINVVPLGESHALDGLFMTLFSPCSSFNLPGFDTQVLSPIMRALSLPWSLCLPAALSLAATNVTASGLLVNLTSGAYEGVSTVDGTDKWFGVRYAQPPIGSLRFKAPIAYTQPLPDVQNASAFGNACPQPLTSSLGTTSIGEDCLNLNVSRSSFPGLLYCALSAYMDGERCGVLKVLVTMLVCLCWFGSM